MTDMVPMYGFGGGGQGGGRIWVHVDPGSQVTLTQTYGGKTKTAVADSSGQALFKGLDSGQWEAVATLNGQTAKGSTIVSLDYQIRLAYFTATINITYPAGLTCKATNGSTTLTAPDTSGTWACIVNKAGTWTVTLGNGLSETVTLDATGENYTLNKWYLLKNGVANQVYKFGDGQLRDTVDVTVTDGDGAIVCKSVKNETVGIATTATVNLAGFAKMSVEYNGNKSIYFGGYSMLKIAYNNIQKPTLGKKVTNTSGIAEVVIAGDPGELYVGVGWSAGSTAATINISNLWLEV